MKRSADRACPRHHSLQTLKQTAQGGCGAFFYHYELRIGRPHVAAQHIVHIWLLDIEALPQAKGTTFRFGGHMSHARQRL